jgi:hypothetical protein
MGIVGTAFDYDVAISFAGEQRREAEGIADHLRAASVSVFYDAYEQADLWGKNLYDHLATVYQHKARYCLMLVSAEYAAKVWTTHERQSAQARALTQNTEYILPLSDMSGSQTTASEESQISSSKSSTGLPHSHRQ